MKLSDVILALEMTSDTSQGFYDLVTRKIERLDEFGMTREEYEATADTLDEHGFKRLPERREINEFRMMGSFADEHDSTELSEAIGGRGTFRRFKSAVRRMGLGQEWYQYRDAQYKRIAEEWCEKCEIELEAEEAEGIQV